MKMCDASAVPEHWHVTASEVVAEYPCDRLADGVATRPLTRGIDIDAPVAVTFRWLCQLRAAPYSYDWIDNRGRQSPRTLTPGLDRLAPGQSFGIGLLVRSASNRHITLRATPAAERLFGLVAMTYQVCARSSCGSRLVVRLVVHEPTRWWQRVRFDVLAWCDLVMMRKQLITLRSLAERRARPLHVVSGQGPSC